MHNENKPTRKNETNLLPKQDEKTATDNQWTSVGGYKGYMTQEQEKTATNNQWNSTIKNSD